jgi:S-adenosylhomocysteine hydrolase
VKIELFRELVAIESGGIRLGRNALIIGYGAIGRRVAARLRGCGFVVSVFDPSQILRDLAIQEGFAEATELRGILPGAELVVGCTGTAVLDLPDYGQIADGAILVSTSSWDRARHSAHLESDQNRRGRKCSRRRLDLGWNRPSMFRPLSRAC